LCYVSSYEYAKDVEGVKDVNNVFYISDK
jgi:hypothetical protein